METKKKWPAWLLIGAEILLLAVVVFAKPVWYAWCDISFYWTPRTETELFVKAYAKEHGLSIAQYPESLIDLLERNPETEAFVLEYPLRGETEVSLFAYEGSSTVPLFLQWDPMWGYEKYGSDVIGITGCGPTCLAMVGYHLTGSDDMTPDKIASFAEKNGYYASGYGSSWTLIREGASALGLKATELPLVKKKMVDAVESGSPVILAMGPGDFTTTGHYIVLTGVEDGAFRVNDPNSRKNSEKLWTYEELEGQIRNIWAMSVQ